MAEEFEGLAELFTEAGEDSDVAIDGAVGEGVEDQATMFEDAGVEPEVDEAGNPVENEDPAQGMKEGADDVAKGVKDGVPIADRLKNAMKVMWDSRWKFAKFIGMEVGKGALFFAGSKAVEAIWDAATKKDPSPVNTQRLKIIQGCNQAGDIIKPIITEWRAWLTAHFDKRNDYGTVTVEGIDISRFQILQAKFSDFTTMQDQIHTLQVTANSSGDVPSAQTLLAKWKEYVGKVVAVGDDIKTKEPLMVTDGLKDHTTDLQRATDALNAV